MSNSSDLLKLLSMISIFRLAEKCIRLAGYAMPVQYQQGIIEEHLHARSHAGLFDVSHMGQIVVRGPSAQKCLEVDAY